jgi:cell division protein FtsQ
MKPGWYVLGSLGLLGIGWFLAPRLGRRLAFFDVRNVEVVGARYVPTTTIVGALKLPASASIFDPLGPVTSRVRKLPGIKTVELTRRLPGTLVVRVTEIVPVALATTQNGLRMVDARGRALPFDPSSTAPDLPLTPAPDSLVAGLLGRMREIDPAFYANVDAAWQVQGDVVLRMQGHRVWLRPDAGLAELRAIRLVEQDLARRGKTYAELDGRFADQVVVRWSAA